MGSILGPLFLICFTDLLKIPLKNSNRSYTITLYADDISLIVNNPDHNTFENDTKKIFFKIHEWFNTNWVWLNKKNTLYNFQHKKFKVTLGILAQNKQPNIYYSILHYSFYNTNFTSYL
jgi:hypothetical protein